jgi:alpha-mannosidase
MWIEPDCNIPSGESLVRQFLYGKRYFTEKFGVDVKVAWLMDSFGYAWTLPQIMKKCGIKYFTTQKLNWNDATLFPYNVFHWSSPDGSSVLAHQTVGSYNESVIRKDMIDQLAILSKRHGIDQLLVLFGKGDHGGGITREMLDRIEEIKKENQENSAKFSTALNYFTELNKISEKTKFPKVNGELYLQYHRGTYTTQAKTKKNNRKAEILLETAEKLSTIAQQFSYKYPQKKLQEAWKKLLLNQFHDILPGSSISEVYHDSEEDFTKIFNSLHSIITEAVESIAAHTDTTGNGYSVLVFNPLSWKRNGIVQVSLHEVGGKKNAKVYNHKGTPIPSQIVETEQGKTLLFSAENVPSLGYKEYRVDETRETQTSTAMKCNETEDEIELENQFHKIQIDTKTGQITSIYNKTENRDILNGNGNVISIFEDHPTEGRVSILYPFFDASIWDAWNIYIYQQQKGVTYTELNRPFQVKLVEEGQVRSKVQVKYKYQQKGRPDTIFTQETIIYRKTPLIEFRLQIDWHTKHRLAKVRFPLNLESDFTTYEIPYGYISRRNPLSPRSSLSERAKWEVPGQKWLDKTDNQGEYGVSLINDCKYGFDSTCNVIGMTLLRSPCYPNLEWQSGTTDKWYSIRQMPGSPATDQGPHTLAYALYSHKKNWKEALTTRKAYEFNYPLLAHVEKNHIGSFPKEKSFLSVKGDNIILTTMKKPEEGKGIIIRFYEIHGIEGEAEIEFQSVLSKVRETDLLENNIKEIPTEGKTIKISIGKHELKTLRVNLSPNAHH